MDTDTVAELPQLRFLRILVTILAGTMICGVLAILVMLVIQFRTTRAPLPDVITLPSGYEASTFTQGPTWFAVVTTDDKILIFDRAKGTLRQEIMIDVE